MHFLITAGGTREYLDPVRFISNASSGRMGYCLARAALAAGHEVTLITAPTALRSPAGARVITIETAAEMFGAVRKHFPACHCLIMAAAVADYTPARPAKTKIKKTAESLTLKLKPTADILRWAATHKKKGQLLMGFALEDRALKARAEAKMRQKRLDMIIANRPSAIGAHRSAVLMKVRGRPWVELAGSKAAIARRALRELTAIAEPGPR